MSNQNIVNPYEVKDNNNSQNTNDTYDSNAIINDLLNKNKEYSKNLTEQGKIIQQTFESNKQLEEQIALLRQENEALKKAQTQTFEQPVQNNMYESLSSDVNSLKSQLDEMRMKEKQAQLTPIIAKMQSLGVQKDNVENVFNTIKETYGVDLLANPNQATANMILDNMFANNQPQVSIPQGGYTQPSQLQMDNAREQAYQDRLARKKAEIWSRLNKK